MRRERRKKIFNPQTMLHLEYSLRTEKENTSAQKHIYHKHMTCNRGKHIQLWQAAIRSSAIYFGAGRRPARQVAVKSVTEAVGWGRGIMSVFGEGRRGGRESHSIALSGWLSRRPWPRRRYGEPEKIRLNCCDFGANSCKTSTAHSLCPF